MNRLDLQKLSNARIREARILFEAGEYSGAYYLAGYSAECAFKACIAKGIQRHDFPDKDRVQKSYSHDLRELARLADPNAELAAAAKASTKFAANWDLVQTWNEKSRYSIWTQNDAEAIIDAIARRNDGVLSWIKRRW